mmetsp:Transcript_143737/g.267856  ORF Transcript_143737/g.267856 Transcript_143737/m.267856 type:complete len:163 (+) Transcript_143737:93-581(+)
MGAAPTNSPCSIVCHSCDNDKGGGDANVAQISLKPVVNDPEANLAAWIRRRSGPECDFGEVFDEIFGGPSPVGEATFAKAFRERGAVFDAKLVFSRISKKGVVGQQEFEQWQDNLEAKELEEVIEVEQLTKKNLKDVRVIEDKVKYKGIARVSKMHDGICRN